MLKPPGMKGEKLFDHMASFARRTFSGERFQPSPHLDLALQPDSLACIAPSTKDLEMGEIMRAATGEQAVRRVAKRKLDSLGIIKAHCEFANDPKRMKAMESHLRLAASISEIHSAQKHEADEKKADQAKELSSLAPAAIKKLKLIVVKKQVLCNAMCMLCKMHMNE